MSPTQMILLSIPYILGNDFNTMDSLVGSSFTPHRHGFHYTPDDSLFLSSSSPALPSEAPPITHKATPIPHHHGLSHGLSITHKAPPPHANLSKISETSEDDDTTNEMSHDLMLHDSNERGRTGTISLGPFSRHDNPLHDSFDDLNIELTNGTNSETTTTTTTTSEVSSNGVSSSNNNEMSSPYFATKLSFPSSLMSTPLESNEDNNGMLRNRHNKDQ